MITKKPVIIPKTAFYFEDNNLEKNQNTNLMLKNSFKDIMNNFLNKEEAGNKNVNRLQQKNCNSADSTSKVISEDCKMQKKVEAAIKWLANYLGIKPSFLLAVCSELNINPNDMADQMKFMEIINELAEHFKLTEKEKKEITKEMGGILGFSI